MTMPTICHCGHVRARHGAVSRMCLDCACLRFVLPAPPLIEPWHGAANRDLRSKPFRLFRERTLRTIGAAGHQLRGSAISCEPGSAGEIALRWFALCTRCSLGVLMHDSAGFGTWLDPLSSAALSACPGVLTYPLDVWEQAGVRGLR